MTRPPKRTKLFFAPLPPRAIRDTRLSALDLRVLACVCLHDRMSKPRNAGQGCYASNKTLAEEVGCDYTRLSATMTRLGQFGYVERRVHPLNKRLRVHVVIYDHLEPANTLPNGKSSNDDAAATVCEVANEDGEIVCRPNDQAHEDAEQSSVNIFRETGNRLGRSLIKNPAEAGPAEEGSKKARDQVSQIEQAFEHARSRGHFNRYQLEAWEHDLREAHFVENDPKHSNHAYRVLSDVVSALARERGDAW